MKFIPLDAVLAEINRLIAELVEKGEDTMFEQGRISAFEDAKLFLDTLEAKEVDLEKELIEWHKEHFKKDGTFIGMSGFYLTNSSQMDIAKHFFELGLNASNPLIDANLDSMQEDYVSLLESRGMKHEEAVIASASYANGVNDVLKRFKAQKGEKV